MSAGDEYPKDWQKNPRPTCKHKNTTQQWCCACHCLPCHTVIWQDARLTCWTRWCITATGRRMQSAGEAVPGGSIWIILCLCRRGCLGKVVLLVDRGLRRVYGVHCLVLRLCLWYSLLNNLDICFSTLNDLAWILQLVHRLHLATPLRTRYDVDHKMSCVGECSGAPEPGGQPSSPCRQGQTPSS